MWGYNSSLAQISISLELDMKTPITWYVIEKNILKKLQLKKWEIFIMLWILMAIWKTETVIIEKFLRNK